MRGGVRGGVRREVWACEEASERPGGEASPKVGPAPEVVEADGGDGGEADVVELRERAREEREILVDGPLVHEVVPEEARAGGAEDDQQRAALARGREHLREARCRVGGGSCGGTVPTSRGGGCAGRSGASPSVKGASTTFQTTTIPAIGAMTD